MMSQPLPDPIVVVAHAVRLPGGVDDTSDFERLLFEGRCGYDSVPPERFDRSLYLDRRRGQTGKSYTDIGGCVSPSPLDSELEANIAALGRFDLTHRQFAQVAARAWRHVSELNPDLSARCGVFVGHSGGTELGGPLTMSTLAQAVAEQVADVEHFRKLSPGLQRQVMDGLAEEVRRTRPSRTDRRIQFNAYSAAALVARLFSLGGPREVIDAACASSLLALSHAATAIARGRIDAAIVGGATYNNVDNLILFSQSQACSDESSSPFDRRASGLISSEGYVAVVITRQSIAAKHGLPILGTICGIGVSSDGRGKSLWAPRTEGQQLAIRRGYSGQPLQIEYLEAHATSTQVGDATELHSLSELLAAAGVKKGAGDSDRPLLVGSVKSNLGHTLEAAGLVGLVKLMIAMRRGEIPPTIHFQQPSSEFDWSAGDIRVVDCVTPWPHGDGQRRCAVNAFGIGGLNGHAVIESPREQTPTPLSGAQRRVTSSELADEPIAIVGRGLVLPGAFNLQAFERLLSGQSSAISDPPPQRWRAHARWSQPGQPFHVATNRGGYIDGYRFDGQPYRIPPKQVQLANPAQMMLIDAVQQAAGEAGAAGLDWPGDRQRTAVIVGTIFGGEFSNQLQVGLRLPELCEQLQKQLCRGGIDTEAAASITAEYRRMMLERYSALLDETGSFTASTLASRIAKSFDLMGGACAVDADDASDTLALMLAIDQLRSGTADVVVCGVAHRSLDLVGFYDLQMGGRLVSSGDPADIPRDCSKVLPGEGVAAVILRRLSDARRAGLPIWGVIDAVQFAPCDDPVALRQRCLSEDEINQQIVQRTGYLSGAHALVRLLAETIRWQAGAAAGALITSVAEDGFQYRLAARHRDASEQSIPPQHTAMQTDSAASQPILSAPPPAKSRPETAPIPLPGDEPARPMSRITLMSSIDRETCRVIRFEGNNEADFEAGLRRAAQSPMDAYHTPVSGFSPDAAFCGGIVAASPEALAAGAEALHKAWQQGKRTVVIDRHLALCCDRGIGDRIAWAFPGQGSQYSAVPAVVREEATARVYLQRLDSELALMGLPAISDQLDDREQLLGHDVWWTQLWILAVSGTLADSLQRSGRRPDLVLGHSFGECGAALHAGVMSLQQALRFTHQRSEAVVMTARGRGQLLSIRDTPSRVEAALASLSAELTITHHNAPQQTVVAGAAADIALLQQALGNAAIASMVIPVPAAFHSPAMEPARNALRSAYGDQRFRPPRCTFFSTAQGRYLAEPAEIRDGLIDQLTTPLLYCSAIQRVVRDGCGLLVEVGPSNVLTRLHRSIVGTGALCVSLDGEGASHRERLALVRLATECVSRVASEQSPRGSIASSTAAAAPISNATPAAAAPVIDVTRRARGKTQPTPIARESTAGGARSNVDESTTVVAAKAQLNGAAAKPSPTLQEEPAATTPRGDLVDQFLIDLVVELTGYSADVIDFAADLEAELGIDSIKKAQIIGELAEWAAIQLDLRSIKLADFQSLADIRRMVGEPSAKPLPSTEKDVTVAAIDALMIDFIVDQTGYSPDIIDADADLEGELGLDSIKKAQLLGELATHYELHDIDLRRLRLADFPTLRSIREFVQAHAAPRVMEAAEAAVSVAVESNKAASNGSPALVNGTGHGANGVLAFTAPGDVKKKVISNALRRLIDQPCEAAQRELAAVFEPEQLASIRAEGPNGETLAVAAQEAGVAAPPLWHWLATGATASPGEAREAPVDAEEAFLAIPKHGTCRFALRMVEMPRLPRMPVEPRLHGAALIVGQNAIADAIADYLRRRDVIVRRLDPSLRGEHLDRALAAIWQSVETPHLFLTTPHDSDALASLSAHRWQRRRDAALLVPFRVCQLWMQRMIDRGMIDHASLASVLNLGGDFGLSASDVRACESGGLAGLTKAMMIEAWTQGYRETPMKVIDISPQTSVEAAVEGIFRELAVPSHDEEVSVEGSSRWMIWPQYRPLSTLAGAEDGRTASPNWTAPLSSSYARQSVENAGDPPSGDGSYITPGGTWVVSGGGRGITALTSLALAEKHALVLHLLGTAPPPSLNETIRRRAASDRAVLRRETISQAQNQGSNPIEAWRDLEKAIEIDQTLAQASQRGVRATYHQVDVSDAAAVAAVLDRIRRSDGPIRGVIHGAGAGQDARFDRKRLSKVEKCFRAKIDGCIALAEATASDPLEWFIGFGSISGRFGANGHTDYSAANEMLAKIINRLRQQRSDVRCVTFHWHAWGDIGMATKPEARLALEMIGMEFMPAEEGLAHFLAEVESGGDQSEVLITDRSYIRKFFPSYRHDVTGAMNLPLLDPNGTKRSAVEFDPAHWTLTIDPAGDRFLTEHRVGGRPTLPFVIALEMIAEAAKWRSGSDVVAITNAEALHALKFIDDQPIAIEVAHDMAGSGPGTWRIMADLRRRDGRIVEQGRSHFQACVHTGGLLAMPTRLAEDLDLNQWSFAAIEYLGPDAPIYHGEPFQMLRCIATGQGEAVGKILTPSPVHLGEEKRPVRGWVIPCAVMDAMLYASAVLAWRVAGRGSLPVHFDAIHLGRSPEPGEALVVHCQIEQQDDTGMILAADLVGLNGDHLLALRGYRIHWLG